MPSLFGSETDAIQERKLVKRLLRKKKITFISCRMLGLKSQLWIYSIILLILGKIGKYGAISLMLLFIYRYRIFYLIFHGYGYLVALLNVDLVLSIFYYWS